MGTWPSGPVFPSVYDSAVELLERDEALATLTGARAVAARGEGRVVFVTGEPGIGKTALVTRFVRDAEERTRVLLGTCDDLLIPRPLGPLRDLAGAVSPQLEQALSAGAAPHDVQSLLLAELSGPRATVLVLEDVHWADDATLDAITLLGRRVRALPALLVLTFRGGEVGPAHPLHAVLGGIRAEDSQVIELAPLSEDAVATLAGERGGELYAASGGNPFYVTELLASHGAAELPPSVANAVLGRAARLDDESRRLVELVSLVPARMRTQVLDAVMPDWPAAAEEPERRQLLEVGARHVRFRHELARHAIQASIPVAGRRRLHAAIVEALVAANADPAEIVHHAEGAGADDLIADFALIAARRAAALESNREAYSHYRRAADFLDRLPAPDQAAALEELANAAYATGRLDDAFSTIEHVIGIHRDLGDAEAVGRCTRVLSRFHWYAGEGEPARAKAREAVAILEPLGESVALARAYGGLSQLAMLADDAEAAVSWGERALALATRLGDRVTRAHALVNLGSAALRLDPAATAPLLEAHATADAAGEPHEAARALVNVAYSLLAWAAPDEALQHAERALAYCEQHEVHALAPYAGTIIAWLALRRGAWEEGARATRELLTRHITVPQLTARTVRAELAVRRGEPDAGERLVELAAQVDRTGDLQRVRAGARADGRVGADQRRAAPDGTPGTAARRHQPARRDSRLERDAAGGVGGAGRPGAALRARRADALRGDAAPRLARRRGRLRRHRLAL